MPGTLYPTRSCSGRILVELRPLCRGWVLGSALVAVLVGGCGQKAASVEVGPDNLLIDRKDGTLQLSARVKDEKGQVMAGAPVVYKAMTPTMATVDAMGVVRAVSSGVATVLVSSGDAAKEVEISIQIPKKILIDPESPWMMLGVTKSFKAQVINDRDNPIIAGEVRWTSSNPEVFTVDSYGNVKSLAEGEGVLTAHAAGITGTTKITVKHEEVHEDGSLSQ